jgi:peptide/nickel transport system substrate-binding protein
LEHLRHRLDRIETLDPSADLPLAANGGTAWFGWPSDDKLEALRTERLKTSDGETRQEIAVKIQARAFETSPYIPTGQWSLATA